MQENGSFHHIHLGGPWLIFFFLVISLALKELLSIFGPGLILQPAMGIAMGTITTFFLFMSLIFRKRSHVQFMSFGSTDADARCKSEAIEALRSLPADCFHFHDLVFKGMNIDHVVLSPRGLMVIHTRGLLGEVSERSGCLLIDGKRADSLIGESWNQAHYIQELLEKEFHERMEILPVLCLPRAEVPNALVVKGVYVTNIKSLAEVLNVCEGTINRSLFFIICGFFAKKSGAKIPMAS